MSGNRLAVGLSTCLFVSLAAASSAHAQVPLTTIGGAYSQSFDTLASTGTSMLVPAGWAFSETGTGANTTYTAGIGSATAGDTYSFGAAASTDRALGTLRSGSVVSTIGASFTNATGATIGSFDVAYHGEQWRIGVVRTPPTPDQLDFQYSLDATSLTTGTWVDVNTLDFVSPDDTSTAGPLNGNDATHQVSITGTIGVSLPVGGTIWIRWTDPDAAPGADDGLGVDDFSLTPNGVVPPPSVTVTKSAMAPTPAGPTSTITYTIDVAVGAGQGIANAVLTDTIPAGTTVSGTTFTVNGASRTFAMDADSGELVGGVLTVRLGSIAALGTARVVFSVTVSPRTADGTVTNDASLTADGAVSGTGFTFGSNTTSTSVVACVDAPSGSIPICQGSVAFDVFFDANGNGMHDAGEPGVGGWGITVAGAGTMMTAADGSATFTGVTSAAPHAVSNTPPTAAGAWTGAFPATVSTTNGMTTTVHVAATCACPDDGDLCTSIPVCNAGACGAPTPMVCDDTNACTDDACVAGACVFTNNTDPCDDAMTTTRDDVCGGGSCAGTTYSCTPGPCEATSVPNGVDCTVTYAAATTPCGSATATGCDAADHCSGTDGTCIDAVATSGTVCRASASSCDPAEVCDGTSATCPADLTTCTDAGMAGTDAGVDAAVDVDAAIDTDAGTTGTDAGMPGTDAGTTRDAGATDAGPRDASAMGADAAHTDAGTTPPPMQASCGCRATGSGGASMAWLAMSGLALVALRRRRRVSP